MTSFACSRPACPTQPGSTERLSVDHLTDVVDLRLVVAGFGRGWPAGLSGFFHGGCAGRARSGVRSGQLAGAGGGRWMAACSCWKASAQGQRSGRCSVSRRARRASRAGMLIRCARMVAVVALVWKGEASAPVARVRLWAMAQAVAQAALAANAAEVISSPRDGVFDVQGGG